MEQGYRHVRCQMDVAGYSTYGTGGSADRAAGAPRRGQPPTGARPARPGSRARTAGWCRSCSSTCASALGDEVELLHDVHERIPPIMAIQLAKDLEPYKLFFLEDPFAPEDNDYFRILRQQYVDADRHGRAVRQPGTSTCR